MSRAVVSLSWSDSWDTTMQTPTCVYTAVQQYCYACSTPVRPWTMYVVSHQSGYTLLYPSDFFHSTYCSRLGLSGFWPVTIVCLCTYANIKIGLSCSYGFRFKDVFNCSIICKSSVKIHLITTADDRFTKTGERFPWFRSVHHVIIEEALLRCEPCLFGGNGCAREWHFPYQGYYHGKGLEWKQVDGG